MALFLLIFCAALGAPVVWPSIDIAVSGFFFRPGEGFFLADLPLYTSLHWIAYDGARALGILFVCMFATAAIRRKPTFGLDQKAWSYLLLALLVGPVLVANVGFKDHWGRARPRELVQFGGTATFSPALEPHFERAHSNGSFVSGDGAFGFFLPAFAFVTPRRTSRVVFWQMMGLGGVFGLVRLAMGAHFFSDVVYAAFFMLTSSTGLCALMYGRQETLARWKSWFSTRAFS